MKKFLKKHYKKFISFTLILTVSIISSVSVFGLSMIPIETSISESNLIHQPTGAYKFWINDWSGYSMEGSPHYCYIEDFSIDNLLNSGCGVGFGATTDISCYACRRSGGSIQKGNMLPLKATYDKNAKVGNTWKNNAFGTTFRLYSGKLPTQYYLNFNVLLDTNYPPGALKYHYNNQNIAIMYSSVRQLEYNDKNCYYYEFANVPIPASEVSDLYVYFSIMLDYSVGDRLLPDTFGDDSNNYYCNMYLGNATLTPYEVKVSGSVSEDNIYNDDYENSELDNGFKQEETLLNDQKVNLDKADSFLSNSVGMFESLATTFVFMNNHFLNPISESTVFRVLLTISLSLGLFGFLVNALTSIDSRASRAASVRRFNEKRNKTNKGNKGGG